MADLTDQRRTYLLGIIDGFRLARAKTIPEAEDLIAEIKASMDARLRDVRAAWEHERTRDPAGETDELDHPPRLN